MAASSSSSQKSDVFPSFRGEDVRTGFLSHLRMELDRSGFIDTFNDNGIERSCEIGPELLWAIREARISIVIFSENYASSKWCLDELAEIHNCYKELKQKVIPVFYKVDPSEVRKQNGEFGEVFMKTCEGKTDDEKQRWKQALTIVSNLAGEHLQDWSDEASMVKKIANDVFNKLLPQSNGFGDFVGIEAHIEVMKSKLCLESEEEVRMIGIWGQSGIGKSTLGRALFDHLSPIFPFKAFVTYRSIDQDGYSKKLFWEKQLLAEIFGWNIKVDRLGMVEPMLKEKKILIILDDVAKLEFLKTLVGKTEWFGPGSRIIVISQDKYLLKAHKIDLLYEVKIPDEDIALMMLCRSAFGQDSPLEGFKKLAVEVTKIAGNLPLGLNVLGSSLAGRTKEEWIEDLPQLQKGLKGDIVKILRVGYDRLEEEDRDIFLYIASLFNGESVKSINDFFGHDKGRLKKLAEKSLIRISVKIVFGRSISRNEEIVEMHDLLEKLGKEIVLEESKDNPGKRRFLTDVKEFQDVLTDQTGKKLRGIILKPSTLESHTLIDIDEKSFEVMRNLQFLKIVDDYSPKLRLPNGLVHLPRKLKWLEWNRCPLKCLPSNFKAEFLTELRMRNSKLEKLWEGTQQLRNLKTIVMCDSRYLKEIPDLSKAINLKRVDFSGCDNLESFPSPLNSESLEYLDLTRFPLLKNFPQIKMETLPHGIKIHVYDCLWTKNLPGIDYLDCLRRCYPLKFLPEHLVHLELKGTKLEKLWDGVKLLGSLQKMDLSYSKNLKEIPDLSKATNLKYLDLSECISLVRLPSTIGNLQKLKKLDMRYCTGLKDIPVDVNLSSLKTLNLNGCTSLNSFPQISRSIEYVNLDHAAIEEVPCCIDTFRKLTKLSMCGCSKLKNISPKIFRLTNLKEVSFTDCGGVITMLSDATIKDPYETIEKGNKVGKDKHEDWYFNFEKCFGLDRDARELIIQSSLKWNVILPGGEVPTYFNHRASGNSLNVTLPQSSLSHPFLRFNVCVVVESVSNFYLGMNLHFHFGGLFYKHHVYVGFSQMLKNHLVVFYFKFQPTGIPSKLESNDVEFKFEASWADHVIKEVGIRLLNVSPSLGDRYQRSFETDCNNQSGEKYDDVETESSKKRMRMTSCDENFNLACDQIVRHTGFISPNMELPLGQGESSSVSSYPCPEEEALWIDSTITEEEDAQLPILRFLSYDVFPSFSGADGRARFFSHLQEALDRSGLINTFKDHGIERSRPMGHVLLSAIRVAKVSIVIFSRNYASSKWCLDELAEIHNCYKKLNQMVIPIFYKVDPSEVRKQNGEFGKVFMKTCEGKSDDDKQRWIQALTDVSNIAGEHLSNGSDEAIMVKKIANDVFDKVFSTPSNGFGDFVGIEAHILEMESILCLESEEVKMVGIWGQSGIGKSALGRALFTHLSPKFPLYAFVTYKSTDQDIISMKLFWEKQLLTVIFDKNIEVDDLGIVEPMLKDKKVLIVLDDVVDRWFLETLVGKTEWFGPGSRIIVISQDWHILKGHKIDLLYEVKIPSQAIALTIFCRSAFGQDTPPNDFEELAVEVVKVVGNLPLGLRVTGLSLKGRTKEEWMELLPRLQNGLNLDIMVSQRN